MIFNLGELSGPMRAIRARERLLARVDHVVPSEILLVVELLAADGARILH